MDLPSFDLPTAEGGRLTRDDLLGRPWFVYLARHPGCFVCQAKLAGALAVRDEVRALGGDVLLGFQAQLAYCEMWVAKSKEQGDLPADLQVLVDPDGTFYEQAGTIRGDLRHEVGKAVGSLWRSRAHIRKWRLTPNDMLRMGADLAVAPDGTLAFRHVCRDPEDRADPRDVLAALRTATPVAA